MASATILSFSSEGRVSAALSISAALTSVRAGRAAVPAVSPLPESSTPATAPAATTPPTIAMRLGDRPGLAEAAGLGAARGSESLS